MSVPVHPVDPPLVISVKPSLASEYNHGLRNPRGFFLDLRRAVLRRDITAAKFGADALF